MDFYIKLLDSYRHRGLVVDTNLLLLLVVGIVDASRIETFKRTRIFTPADFDLLARIVSRFSLMITTPNILTEVSNLLPQDLQAGCRALFTEQVPKLDESYLPSKLLVAETSFVRLGLTDTGIIEVARNRYLVLTVDLPLDGYLRSAGIDVINFNHVRQVGLLS